MLPNVVLAVIDAARRDSFEPYGAEVGQTPAIAQLAGRGGIAPHPWAAACWTAPSHAAMFAGQLPRAAGLSHVPGGSPHACRAALQGRVDRLLPEVLRRSGYATGAVSANLWLSEASGFAAGFEEFRRVDSGRNAKLHKGGLRERLEWDFEAVRASVDDGAQEVERILADWIEQGPRLPFFWFVNLIECHSPYLPPRPYNDLSPPERLRAGAEQRRYLNLEAIWQARCGAIEVPEEAVARMRHLYGRSVRYADAWLGHLLERLDDRGLLDDTLVVVTADHGENLGEGGLVGHALSLDSRLLDVPLVAAGPGHEELLELSSLAELPRLLARAIGLDDHPWNEELPAGIGVAQLDPPLASDDPRLRETAERWRVSVDLLAPLTTSLTCATDGEFKLLLTGDGERFVFDLLDDPLELRPLSADDVPPAAKDRVAALGAVLEHPSVTAPAEAERADPQAPPPDDELRQIEERMRLLGYM